MSMDPFERRESAEKRAEAPDTGAREEDAAPGNPMTADGFAIAARAGARLAELEPALAPLADPLAEFFYREGEPGSSLLETGVAVAAKRDAGPTAEPRREYLTFLLGAEEYGIDIGHVREILKAPPITEVPRAAAHILGVITVRGEVIAVVDPRKRLKLPSAGPTGSTRVVVCDAGEGPCGLLVDAVSQVVRLAPSSIEPRPSGIGGIDTDYISGIGRHGGMLIVLLDAGMLLRRPAAGIEASA